MAKKGVGKSVEDFRKNHDRNYIVPEKIRAGIAQIGDGWVYESEFLKLASLSTTDLATFRDQFEDFWVVADKSSKKRVWCGSEEFAAQLREMVG